MITNPFTNNPIDEIEKFAGREEALQYLQNFFQKISRSEGPSGVFICGEKGLGKTSLARSSLDGAKKKGFQLLDIYTSLTEGENLKSLESRLIGEIKEKTSALLGKDPWKPETTKTTAEIAIKFLKYKKEKGGEKGSPKDLRGWIKSCLENIRSKEVKALVLVVNDVQNMGSAVAELADKFRSLRNELQADGYRNIGFIFSGDPNSLAQFQRNPSNIRAQTIIKLDQLSPEESEELISKALQSRGTKIDEKVKKNLIRMSGGLPSFLQKMGLHTFEKREDEFITTGSLQEAWPRIWDDMLNTCLDSCYPNYYKDHLKDLEKEILKAIAMDSPGKPIIVPEDLGTLVNSIQRTFENKEEPLFSPEGDAMGESINFFSEADIVDSLKRLNNYGFLSCDQGRIYRFSNYPGQIFCRLPEEISFPDDAYDETP